MDTKDFPLPGRKLPVWAVVTRSYLYVWEHRRLLAIPTLMLFTALVAASLLIARLAPPGIRPESAEGIARSARTLAISFASYCVMMSFVVGVHRTVLLDEIRPGAGFLRWDANTLRYFGTVLLIAALAVPAILGFLFLMGFGAAFAKISGMQAGSGPVTLLVLAGIGFYLFLISVYLRLSLALPAAALGDRDRLTLSWRATGGNVSRLFCTAALTALPVILTEAVLVVPGLLVQITRNVQSLGEPADVSDLYWAALLGGAAIKALSTPVLTTMLSLCYDVLVRGGGPSSESRPG